MAISHATPIPNKDLGLKIKDCGASAFCLSQPFFVAEAFTGLKGVLVDIKDTIKGFNAIMDGEYDHLPEMAFNLVGSIEDAVVKGEKMMAEANA